MKKLKAFLSLFLIATLVTTQTAYAKVGDMGFFGGISEGTRLPKTTEILLANSSKNKATNTAQNLNYKETIFLSGRPVTFEGTLVFKPSVIKEGVDVGSYKETLTVRSNASTADDVLIDRAITFNVNYRKEGNQIIKDYEAEKWSETITTPEGEYALDFSQSHFGVSIIEDHTAGVMYYKGNISQTSVYTGGEGGEGEENAGNTVLDVVGSFYGYSSAWSSTETHRLDGTVTTDNWQLQYQVRPSVSVAKLIQYSQNEPTAISFDGNYKEVIQNTSGMEYDIFVKPNQFYDIETHAKINIPTYNTFEQLIAPDLKFLQGHFAEYDIKKLFAMQVLEGDPKFYLPNQSITRGQYVTALVKAIKLPIQDTATKKKPNSNTKTVSIMFPDVPEERSEYPYIMAAYDYGLAVGRENGNFFIDQPLDRQEAISVLVRSIGLKNLGLDPTPLTVFADDYLISDWAKQEIYAAERMGIIAPDEDGNFRPNDYVTKAEAAAFINALINYMRTELAIDYSEHIVNYAY